MENKKASKAQLETRINKSLVFVPSDKDTQRVYFPDKGVSVCVTGDYAVIKTNFHTHVFNSVTSNGYSRPYIYAKQFVNIALNVVDCKTTDADGQMVYSYQKLIAALQDDKEHTPEYLVVWLFDKWLYNIFIPLFSIDETNVAGFIVYMDYLSNIAKNEIILAEHKEGLTNKQFVKRYIDNIRNFTKGMADETLFVAKTDEDVIKEEMQALNELDIDAQLKNENQ